MSFIRKLFGNGSKSKSSNNDKRLESADSKESDIETLRAKYFSKIKQAQENYNKNQLFISTSSGAQNGRNVKVIFGKDIEDVEKIDEYFESPEIRRLALIMLTRSPQNIKYMYNNDDSAFISYYLLSSALNGSDGIKCKSDDEELAQYINDYLELINVKKIQDWTIKDNHCFADSVFWKEYNEEKEAILIHHIDYVTLTRVKNNLTGDVKWVQAKEIDSRLPKTKSKAQWKQYDPYLDYFHNNHIQSDGIQDQMIITQLFEDEVVNFNYFSVPPMNRIIELMVWKKWMEFDAKLTGQKFASPILDAEVTLPEFYEVGSQDYFTLLDDITKHLLRLQSGGIITHSDKIKVQELNHSADKYDFQGFLTYANKQIQKTLLAPFNLLEASGSELATSRTIKDIFNIIVESLRNIFIREIKKLVMEQLDFVGLTKVSKDDFQLIYPEIDSQAQMSQAEEFDKILEMYDRGIIVDPNEIRSYVRKFKMEFEPLSKKELAQAQAQNTNQDPNYEDDDVDDDDIQDTMKDDKNG